jgi:3-oxoadipate enol-lactonase
VNAARVDRFHLVGESLGGTVGVAFALAEPQRLLSLTLSNAAARGGLIDNVVGRRELVARRGQSDWARQMMEWRFYKDALSSEVYHWYLRLHENCSIDATLDLADLLLSADYMVKLGNLQIPTLLLSPDDRPFIALDMMADMHAEIPDSELQVFAHSRHGLPLSHGKECAEALARIFHQRGGETSEA